MSWLSLLLAVAKLLNIGIKYADERQLLDAGAKAVLAEQLNLSLSIVAIANEIRDQVRPDNLDTQLDWLQPHKHTTTDK